MPGKMKVIIEANAGGLAKKAAEIFCKTAIKSVDKQDRFAVAVSGGSTPRAMYRLLSQEPYLSEIPWNKTHIFWVDERMVPFDHPYSNFGAARKDFLDKIPISPEQVHPMPMWENADKGAALYQTELKDFFQSLGSGDPVFDLIFLGTGKDGHTASLFPGESSSETPEKWVLSVQGGHPYVYRLTLTYAVLNQAKHILFLVSGNEKAQIIKKLFENKHLRLPAQRIQPLNGKLTWLLDRKAASLLSEKTVHDKS